MINEQERNEHGEDESGLVGFTEILGK